MPKGERLTPQMLAVLASIAYPHEDDEPLPPENTVRALLRRGLLEMVEDKDDVIARMLGAVRLEVTPAGRQALSGGRDDL